MEPKGTAFIKAEFVATKIWPPKETFNGLAAGITDMEQHYKECLAGKPCTVMDISVGSGPKDYLVLGKSDKIGHFIWNIKEEDTIAFLPIYKENGDIVPAGLSGIDKFKFMAEKYLKKMNKDE